MLIPLSNTPRDYAWGSTRLLAKLEGRTPSGRPEAEVWFGDHPGDPADTPDGRTLNVWRAAKGEHSPLPFLLKLLAAGSPLSIQAHPSKAQAEEGFAREEAAGVARDAPARTYRDDNHKPELIVALSEEFHALAGLRHLQPTRRLVRGLGAAAGEFAEQLDGEHVSLADVIGWVFAPASATAVREAISAAVTAQSEEFADELALARSLHAAYPFDPGILVALLMNLVTLRRGEGLFVPAGMLHAYLSGLGVELMAASDNVLRAGLTPKHVDVPQLLTVVDAAPVSPPIVHARVVADGIEDFDVPVRDFRLTRVTATAGCTPRVCVSGSTLAICVSGSVEVGAGGSESVQLRPGAAVYATADVDAVIVEGHGEVFFAMSRTP